MSTLRYTQTLAFIVKRQNNDRMKTEFLLHKGKEKKCQRTNGN